MKPVFHKYPEIPTFSEFCKQLKDRGTENVEMHMTGTVKVEGQQMCVCQCGTTRWYQDRNGVLTKGKDPFNFLGFCNESKQKSFFDRLIKDLLSDEAEAKCYNQAKLS